MGAEVGEHAGSRRGRRIAGLVILSAAAVIAFILGYVGFRQFYPPPNAWTPVDYAYEAFRNFWMWAPQNPAVRTPLTLSIARFLAPLVALSAGISAVLVLFGERLALWWRLTRAGDHTIICGLGTKGAAIAERLDQIGHRLVCIERVEAAEGVALARERGVPVLIGDGADPVLLNRAGLHRAANVVAATGDDGVNALIALRARQSHGDDGAKRLVVLAHVVDPLFCDLLSERFAEEESRAQLRFFNIFDGAAAAILNVSPAWGSASAGSPAPSVLLLGEGALAQRLPLHLAKRWQIDAQSAEPLRITFLGEDVGRTVGELLAQHPGLESLCVLEPLEHHSGSTLATKAVAARQTSFSAAYVYGPGDAQVIKAALTAAREMPETRVVACLDSDETGLAALLCSSGSDVEEEELLSSFPLLQGIQDPHLLFGGMVESLAREIHRSYIAERTASGETDLPALTRWEDLSADDREQNIGQARDIVAKFERIGCVATPIADWDPDPFTFRPDEIDLLAREEHQRWWELRREQGWVFGPERDNNRKIHPCMVPYDHLPETEQVKDREAVLRMPRLLASVGYRPKRTGELGITS